MTAGRVVAGEVVAFDAAVGLGTVRCDDGAEVPFHATQLADGTRAIAVGTRVAARRVPWHLGRDELVDVVAEPAR